MKDLKSKDFANEQHPHTSDAPGRSNLSNVITPVIN